MEKKKIVCVNYLNTKPLIRALDQQPYSNYFELIPENPRVCSEKYQAGVADIALVPVAVLASEIKDYQIISDYCIASDGDVATVGIFSDSELKDISKIYLDDHSKTSQQLTKIIFEDYLNIYPEYQVCDVSKVTLDKNEGVLMIGDKAFTSKSSYENYFDLGGLWTQFTSLPFVYAVWISREKDQELEKLFNEGVAKGLEQIETIIDENKVLHPDIDLASYYKDHIHYDLEAKKLEGLNLFLKTLKAKNIPSLS